MPVRERKHNLLFLEEERFCPAVRFYVDFRGNYFIDVATECASQPHLRTPKILRVLTKTFATLQNFSVTTRRLWQPRM